MADRIRKVEYYYTTVPDQPGESAKILGALKKAGVNLLAYHAFPAGGGKAQVDIVPADAKTFLDAAKKAGIKLSEKKTAFVVEGPDRVGAVADLCEKLAAAKVNITAIDAVCAGEGRYGALFWVKSADVDKAAKAVGAK